MSHGITEFWTKNSIAAGMTSIILLLLSEQLLSCLRIILADGKGYPQGKKPLDGLADQ